MVMFCLMRTMESQNPAAFIFWCHQRRPQPWKFQYYVNIGPARPKDFWLFFNETNCKNVSDRGSAKAIDFSNLFLLFFNAFHDHMITELFVMVNFRLLVNWLCNQEVCGIKNVPLLGNKILSMFSRSIWYFAPIWCGDLNSPDFFFWFLRPFFLEFYQEVWIVYF